MSHRPNVRRSRRILATAAAFVSMGSLAVVASATPAHAASTSVNWRPCGNGFFCGRALVPLDYDDPDGARISIALAKLPATDQAHKIGSVFINPGGPGGSGVGFVLGDGRNLFTPQVRARFDIVGFDPRGIALSSPLRCFDTMRQAGAAVAPFPYPNSAQRRAEWFGYDRKLVSACASRGSAILDHMATADVARDMDRLREAVGDDQLTYYGVSYGSFLGNTYANLFPGRVRSLVIDGVLDPTAWTTGRPGESDLPFSTRLHSARGALATLDEFFRLCDAGGSRCAFAPNSRARFYALYRSLREDPRRIAGTKFDETILMAQTLGAMYGSAGWRFFAGFLADLERGAASPTLARDLATVHQHDAPYYNDIEGFPGVACSDSHNPDSPSAWTQAAAEARRQDGIFGPIWTWITSVCAHWPGQDADRYDGPFTNYTAHPVLVVGNEFDPATPYQGAEAAAALLPNSRLLTVHGWGHTSLSLSHCADRVIGHYLLTSQVPAAGTVCEQDHVPFAGPSSPAKAPAWQPVPGRVPSWTA